MEAKASKFFTKDQADLIRDAVKHAEKETSGEIRIHIETTFEGDVLDRAAWIFKKIGMHATDKRSGVLFYVAVEKKRFAIIGDRGINALVPATFWNDIKEILQEHFKNGEFTEGLIKGVRMAGEQLREHFPRSKDDINELPDDISFDNPE